MRFADLDAVTVDAFGTLVELIDPVPALGEALSERGIDRPAARVEAAFRAEVAYYRGHLGEARDAESLDRLRVSCAEVFLRAAEADLAAAEFAPAFVRALRFRVLGGVAPALAALRARGLELAVVGNWDISLAQELEELGLASSFAAVLPLAAKPSPEKLLEALRTLHVTAGRALHVGDEAGDAHAAGAAGMHYLPAPLPRAVAELQ